MPPLPRTVAARKMPILNRVKTKKTFPSVETIEDFNVKKLDSMINFSFKKYGCGVEIDVLSHPDRDPVKEKTRQKKLEEYLGCDPIRSNPDEKDFSAFDLIGKAFKFTDEFKEREIKKIEKRKWGIKKRKWTIKKGKKFFKGHDLKRLLELEFKSNNSIKSKCLK